MKPSASLSVKAEFKKVDVEIAYSWIDPTVSVFKLLLKTL